MIEKFQVMKPEKSCGICGLLVAFWIECQNCGFLTCGTSGFLTDHRANHCPIRDEVIALKLAGAKSQAAKDLQQKLESTRELEKGTEPRVLEIRAAKSEGKNRPLVNLSLIHI